MFTTGIKETILESFGFAAWGIVFMAICLVP